MIVLVTGSTGFIGQHLVPFLAGRGFHLRAPVRDLAAVPPSWRRLTGVETVFFPVGSGSLDALMVGVSSVVHLAGLAAVPSGPRAEAALQAANVDLTAALVAAAKRHEVQRFLFLSSIRAVGGAASDLTIDDATPAQPVEPYGRSKIAAEQQVAAFAEHGRVAISLRPPLVVGPGARGNWQRLQRLAASGAWLPFAGIQNRRSYVAMGTLCAAIAHLLVKDLTAEQSGSYCLANPEALSLPEVITAMRTGLRQPPRLFHLPGLTWTMRLPKLSGPAGSLFGSLQVDASRFEREFSFVPPQPLRDAIAAAAAAQAARP